MSGNAPEQFSRDGDWGKLSMTRVEIAVPEEFIMITPETTATRWTFPDETVEDVIAVLEQAGFTEELLDLIPGTLWRVFPDRVVIEAPPELVLKLPEETRGKLYRHLARSFENLNQRMPLFFRPQSWAAMMSTDELSAVTKKLLRGLAYSNGDSYLVADGAFLMSQVADSEERAHLAKLLSRRETFLVRLMVDGRSDLEKIAAYWSNGGQRKDVLPLLDSLSRVPGGARIDITHFLPPFARHRLYTYPFPNLVEDITKQDCHWTALNFFNDVPDERFTQPSYTKAVVERDYVVLKDEKPRFGDLVVVFTDDSEIIHSAVYIADEIVYTKNGGMAVHPWMFMKLESMIERYSSIYLEKGSLPYRFLRRVPN